MAYNRYQYETSPRKLEPEYDFGKEKSRVVKKVSKDTHKKEKRKLKVKAKVVLGVFIGFLVLFAICYRDSQITEIFNKKENLKKQLSTAQKENEQLKISIENSLNLNTVEQLAKERLGMQKLNNKQKIYVSLEKKDYIEQAAEEIVLDEDVSLWDKIFNTLFGKN